MAARVELEPCPACRAATAAVTQDYVADETAVVVAGPLPVAVRCPNPECDPPEALDRCEAHELTATRTGVARGLRPSRGQERTSLIVRAFAEGDPLVGSLCADCHQPVMGRRTRCDCAEAITARQLRERELVVRSV